MVMKKTLIALSFIVFLALSLVIPYVSARTPPYIQTGLKFVYQLYNGETQQPENAYHSYIIESVTQQSVSIRIESDIVKSIDLEVDEEGNIVGGKGRIDLWIPQGLQVGQSLNILGYDATVLQKGYDIDKSGRLTYTIIASNDQSMFWLYVDGGSANEAKQLMGLLYGILFPNSKKILVLIGIQQSQPMTTTTTSKATTVSTISKTSTEIHTRQGVTSTQVVVTEEATTVTQTIVTTVALTTTVERTVTYQTEVLEASFQPFIPLPIAIVASIAIIGGAFFIMKARRRPLPPTYPYPLSPIQSPQYVQQLPTPHTPPPPQQIVGRCPACGYPIYSGEKDCRRCNYRIA